MKTRKILLIAMALLLVLSPLSAATVKQEETKTTAPQTAKTVVKETAEPKTTVPVAKAEPKTTEKTVTTAKKEVKPVKPAVAPASSESGKYASDPTGWWNDLWTDAHFSYDLFAKSTLLRGENVPGGGLSLGVETEKFRFEGYAQADYFLKPFAGEGIATMELNTELGVNASWKFLEFWAFDIWASCDIGYYTQLVNGLPYASDQLVMGYSGLMIRPKLLTELKIAKYYGLTLGFYYQMPVYPAYSDYNGLGIMLSIC